jgi:hypothetical protein
VPPQMDCWVARQSRAARAIEDAQSWPTRDEVVYETGPRRDPWHFRRSRVGRMGRLVPALTCGFSGADDGTRTRDPHLGNSMADVSCVSAGLSSVAELRVLGDLVSWVSADRWSRLHFVGDFVGVRLLENPLLNRLRHADRMGRRSCEPIGSAILNRTAGSRSRCRRRTPVLPVELPRASDRDAGVRVVSGR